MGPYAGPTDWKIMRIAIVQNAIIYGGRLAVMIKMIEALNERGVTPDIISLKANMDPDRIWDLYGLKISFNLLRIQPVINRLPAEISILAFNMALRREYTRYDFLIDSNNTSFLMPRRIPVLSYVHYPRIARLKSRYVNIHHPQGSKTNIKNLNGAMLKLLSGMYSFQTIKANNLVVANSRFTRNAFQRAFPTYGKRVPILYPPVESFVPQGSAWETRANIVCSVGRFCPEKNQMAQIRLAQKTSDYQFNLVGFTDPENDYYQRCTRYCRQNRVKNVFFFPNKSSAEKNEILQKSMFFLHPNVNEPFGITTVEAVLSGCLPLVHNSGGQKEIVPYKELRFENMDGLHSVLRDCAATKSHFAAIQKTLVEHCRENFTGAKFKEKFNSILDVFQTGYLT